MRARALAKAAEVTAPKPMDNGLAHPADGQPDGPGLPQGRPLDAPDVPGGPRTEGVAAERRVGPEAGANGIGVRIEARPSGSAS